MNVLYNSKGELFFRGKDSYSNPDYYVSDFFQYLEKKSTNKKNNFNFSPSRQKKEEQGTIIYSSNCKVHGGSDENFSCNFLLFNVLDWDFGEIEIILKDKKFTLTKFSFDTEKVLLRNVILSDQNGKILLETKNLEGEGVMGDLKTIGYHYNQKSVNHQNDFRFSNWILKEGSKDVYNCHDEVEDSFGDHTDWDFGEIEIKFKDEKFTLTKYSFDTEKVVIRDVVLYDKKGKILLKTKNLEGGDLVGDLKAIGYHYSEKTVNGRNNFIFSNWNLKKGSKDVYTCHDEVQDSFGDHTGMYYGDLEIKVEDGKYTLLRLEFTGF